VRLQSFIFKNVGFFVFYLGWQKHTLLQALVIGVARVGLQMCMLVG